MTRPTPPPIDPEVVRWHVVHTRPRCEKKVAAYCEREGIQVCLPLYRSVKKYRGKAVEFRKPLFTGYLFFRAPGLRAQTVRQHQQVARVLVPPDDAEFDAQLGDILRALDTDREIRLAPHIQDGMRVKIVRGPLRGLDGVVERRTGLLEVCLRLDFISQCAAVRVTADEVEPV